MATALNRRALITGAVSLAASPAAVSPSLATAPIQQNEGLPESVLAMKRLALEGNELSIMEVLGNGHAPHYRKADLLFVQAKSAKASDHVFIRPKAAPPLLAVLVHLDRKALYVRGFNSGDKMRAVPFTSVTEWGRVAITYRA